MTARDILQVLIELAPDVITLIDRDNVIRYISPSVERVAGYTPEEMIGKRCDEFVASGDLEALRNAFSKTLETRETVTSLIHFRRKDGGSIPLESLARNYLDVPEIDGILVSSRDMSRHIDLESTLRRSAEESADLFENAPCGYHTVDANDAFRRINVTELRWLQRTRDELVGKAKFSDFLSPVDRSAYGAEFEILKKGGAVRSDEFEVVRKDGTAFPALLQSMAVRDGSEAFVECRTTVYDITERKRCEYALTKVNRALHVLADARKQIISAQTETGLLSAICTILVERGGYRLAAVHFVQHDADSTMKLVAKAGFSGQYMDEANITWADTARGQGPTGRAVRSGLPQINRNSLTDPHFTPWRELARRYGFQSSMTVPLKDDAGVFGTLSVYASEVDAFHTEEDRVICELASDVSFGIGSLFAQRFAEEHAALKGKGAAERLDPMAKLSQREREVLELVVQGKSSKQIAHHLGIAPASVDTYRSRIMTKLAIDDITGLVRLAIRHGLVQP